MQGRPVQSGRPNQPGDRDGHSQSRQQREAEFEAGRDAVTQEQDSDDTPAASFHEISGALRFWVAMPSGPPIGAILSRQVLHYRFGALMDGSDAVATYETHRGEIDAAVVRRVAGGSIEPVMLRENDLPRT